MKIFIFVGILINLKWMLKLWVNLIVFLVFKFGVIFVLYNFCWILFGVKIMIMLVNLVVFVIV